MEPKKSALFIGASRGIGRTFALEAARRGINPIAVARRFDPDDAELLEVVTPIHADVSAPAGWGYLKRERVWHLPFVFWVAGAYHRGSTAEMETDAIDHMLDMHQRVMTHFIRETHRSRLVLKEANVPGPNSIIPHLPYTLVVMGSISSYRLRTHEAAYAMAKAGQAAFLRSYAGEAAEDFPGSRVLLVNCARLGTEPGEQKMDAGGRRIDPGFVAKLVWGLVDSKDPIMNRPFTQINIERTSDKPIVTYGPQLPEIP